MAIFGNLNICVKNKVNDNDGRVLILLGSDNLLINLYNTNTKREQLITLENLNYFHDKKVIIAGDFNLILIKSLNLQGVGVHFSKKRLLEIIKLKETFNLCDIWRLLKAIHFPTKTYHWYYTTKT